jgi:hypothetical protein
MRSARSAIVFPLWRSVALPGSVAFVRNLLTQARTGITPGA